MSRVGGSKLGREGRAVTVGELSRDELKRLVAEAVEEKLLELLGDPDDGMILREEIRARLARTLEDERGRRRGASLPRTLDGCLAQARHSGSEAPP